MRRLLSLFPVCLTIHDGAAAAAAPAGEGGATSDGQALGGAQLPEITIRGKKLSGEDKPAVLYGKQPEGTTPVAGEKATPSAKPAGSQAEQTPEQRQAAFKELINGEYKDEFKSYFQETFDKRFKGVKTTQEQLDALKPTVDLLADKYGITDGDPKKLADAVNNDNKLWEELAEDAGMTVQQYKEFAGMKRELNQSHVREQQADKQAQQNQLWQDWTKQTEALKASKYPKLDLGAEILANPEFAKLLNAGSTVEMAYQAIHFDDIVSGVVQTVGKRAEEAVTNRLQTKSARPSEAGASTNPGIVVKDDPAKMTNAELKEVALRARRGEQIKF